MIWIDRRAFLAGAAAGAALLTLPRKLRAAAPAGVSAKIEAELEASVARIQKWIQQPSVSAQNIGIEDCNKLTMELLKEVGFQTVKRMPTDGHPGIFATLDVGAKKTLGLYFMYDVQPVEEKEWASPPWKAAIVDHPMGKAIMGRGAVNQKGPQGAFLAAVSAIRAAKEKLPVNLVLVAEGEEELGSPHFAQVVHKPEVTRALKKASGVIMPSASQSPSGTVGVRLGAKGIVYVELEASGKLWGKGPRQRDVHSSLKAAVDSPVWRLVQALQTLVSADGNTPAIDGLFDDVRKVTDFEKKLFDEMTARENEEDFKKQVGVDRWIDDLDERGMWERLYSQPTVNIDGLYAGYIGEGSKTILPTRAIAKLDIRLVPNMTAKDVLAKLRKHLDKRGFKDISITNLGSYDPTETAYESSLVQSMLALYKEYGAEANVSPRGPGSWPGYLFTGKPVSRPAGHFGLGYGDGAHSRDEIYLVEPKDGAKVSGLKGAIQSFADFMYATAKAKG
jgi:acetylornithine deacetylase/succinyl-diaminopimelate desuccinylase-like protein